MPDELCDVLRDVLGALSRGMAITVAPTHTTLTTSDAAELLGVPRPTLVKLLEEAGLYGLADDATIQRMPHTDDGDHA